MDRRREGAGVVVVEEVVDQPGVVAQVIEVEALDQRRHRHLLGVGEEGPREGVEDQAEITRESGLLGKLFVGNRVPFRPCRDGIVTQHRLHLGPRVASGDLPKVVHAFARERDQVDQRRGRDPLKRHAAAVLGPNQVVVHRPKATRDAGLGQEEAQVVVVAKEGMKAVGHADRRAVGHGRRPGAELAAQRGVAFEEHDLEAARGQLGGRAQAREPAADHRDPLGLAQDQRLGLVDGVEGVPIAAEASLDPPGDQALA